MISNVQKETEMKISDIPEVVKKRPLRQRCLYTSHSYHGTAGIDDVKNDFKNLDEPPSDHWTIPTAAQSSTSLASLDNWRARPRAIRASNQASVLTSFYPTDDPSAYTETFGEPYGDSYPDSYGDCIKEGTQQTTAVATPHGTMSMRLRDHVRVDMTVDQAVRVINFKTNIVMAMSASGGSVALLHPNGRVYQYGSRVEILAHDADGNEKYAKMWYKGVSFTSEQCALVYLVDAAGTRTTTDTFSDMTKDFSLPLFYEESRHGPSFVTEAINLLKRANYWMTDDGVDNWIVNGVRISQTSDGLVRVARQSNKYQMRTSPSNGTASLTTPFMHCTASMGNTSHLFVRRGERRMHFDGTSFIVRNAGHSAGFDEKNQLKVY